MIYYLGAIPYSSDYLCHHGILGMKWGVRRFRNRDGTLTDEGKRRYSSSEMSDEELRKNVNRMRSEAEYNRLSKELYNSSATAKAISLGTKVAGKILSTTGDAAVAVASSTIVPLASNFFREMGTGLGRSMFGSNGGGNGKKRPKGDDDD